jgi:flagellar biosynthesis/type III secretory pathway protein FliH
VPEVRYKADVSRAYGEGFSAAREEAERGLENSLASSPDPDSIAEAAYAEGYRDGYADGYTAAENGDAYNPG